MGVSDKFHEPATYLRGKISDIHSTGGSGNKSLRNVAAPAYQITLRGLVCLVFRQRI